MDDQADREEPWVPERESIPQPQGGALKPWKKGDAHTSANDPETGNWAKARKERQRIDRAVRDDPGAALEEIHVSLTLLTKNLLNRAARSKTEVPSKAVMDTVREFRQTQEAVNVARQARGAVAEAEEFFAEMDTRVEEAAARMEAGPEPALTPAV